MDCKTPTFSVTFQASGGRSMSTKKFNEVFAQEVDKISQRREKLNSQRPDNQKRQKIDPEQEDQKDDGTPIMRPTPDPNVGRLSLSGAATRPPAPCMPPV